MPRRTKGSAAVERKAQALKRLEIEWVDVANLNPNSYNPNRQSDHDFELLVRSIMEDGFTEPVVAVRMTPEFKKDKAFSMFEPGQMVITDGEHRWTAVIVVEALRRAGVTDTSQLVPAQISDFRKRRLDLLSELSGLEMPVAFAPMTPSQMRIATLRHNRARGSEDIELTGLMLHDLEELGALGWAQDSLMMEDVEISALMEDVPAAEALAGDEYGQAWEVTPTPAGDVPPPQANLSVGMTQAAVEEMRRRDEALRTARSEEERAAARRDIDTYRISLVFSGEEAKLVRAVLGEAPADRMLDLCKSAQELVGAKEAA